MKPYHTRIVRRIESEKNVWFRRAILFTSKKVFLNAHEKMYSRNFNVIVVFSLFLSFSLWFDLLCTHILFRLTTFILWWIYKLVMKSTISKFSWFIYLIWPRKSVFICPFHTRWCHFLVAFSFISAVEFLSHT